MTNSLSSGSGGESEESHPTIMQIMKQKKHRIYLK